MIHTDSALILQHDESHTIEDMTDLIRKMIDAGEFEPAKRVSKGLSYIIKNILDRKYTEPYCTKSDVPFCLRECAV